MLVATGSRPALDPLGPFNVDYEGTKNIVAAAKNQGVEKIVLVTSIGVDDTFFPLNLFWGVCSLDTFLLSPNAINRQELPLTLPEKELE